MPRGLGWVIMPVMAGLAGAKLLPVWVQRVQGTMELTERDKRFAWVGSGGWLVLFNGYWFLAKPYNGYRMSDEDWHRYFEILVGAPIVAVLGAVALKWANAGSTAKRSSGLASDSMIFPSASKSTPNAPVPPTQPDMTRQAFSSALARQLAKAQQEGKPYLDVNSGELHRVVGGYPAQNHRMPTCCDVMREFMRDGDVVIYTPPLAKGATFAVRYMLPR